MTQTKLGQGDKIASDLRSQFWGPCNIRLSSQPQAANRPVMYRNWIFGVRCTPATPTSLHAWYHLPAPVLGICITAMELQKENQTAAGPSLCEAFGREHIKPGTTVSPPALLPSCFIVPGGGALQRGLRGKVEAWSQAGGWRADGPMPSILAAVDSTG